MSIVIFGDLFTFPEGNAATNRVYTYAKGFTENGIIVHVICFGSQYNSEGDGQTNGIKFYHPFGQRKRNKYFVIRRFQKLLKYFNAIKLIKRINNDEKIIAINSWTDIFLNHLLAWFLAKIFKTKLIVECSEHPLRQYQNGALKKKIGILKFYLEANLCDGVFCISQFLVDFYRKYGVNQRKLFLVPSTVDPARFTKTGENPITRPYIGYFGSLTFVRDNVDLLIRAFARVSSKHSEMQLVLGGFCSESEKKQLLDLIAELNIQSKVQLLGFLTREEILTYISHADILVMVRSNDLQSKASYPSKLTEFLASSKPVITVNVGEIPLYLSDGVNAFLVEPGNPDALAKKLNYVIRNYELAQKVGQKGKELTDTIFNYNYQVKRMIGFINSLYS